MSTVYINGKFAAQRITGVQRVAHNLLRALDDRLAAQASTGGDSAHWVLLYPPGAVVPALRRIEARQVGSRFWPLHLWEQWVLPRAARSGLLLSLAGSAPLLAVRQVCLFHDAAVFDRPEAYTPWFNAWYRFAFRWLSGRAERLLTVSAFSRSCLARHLLLPESQIGIVPNGAGHLLGVPADMSVFQRLGLEGKSYFLAVGSRNPNKNLPKLLEAFRGLVAPSALRLVLVGGMDHRVFAALKDSPGAMFSSADNSVVDAGVAPDGQLRALYEHALALVFPSTYEGSGLPPLEAMSCGCPVLCSNAASLPEVCGEAALYFDPTSVEAIRAAMDRVLQNPELTQGLRERGRARAGRLNWSAAADALLAQLPQRPQRAACV